MVVNIQKIGSMFSRMVRQDLRQGRSERGGRRAVVRCVELQSEARTQPEACFTIRLFDAIALGCQTRIPHRVHGGNAV